MIEMTKSSVFFITYISLVVLFTVILITAPNFYNLLTQEDHLVENMTALALLFTGFLFIKLTLKSSNKGLTFLFTLVALVFLFGAGEEISWGQRIFGWETPEDFKAINDQDETNLHNINKKFFDRAVDRLTILFVLSLTILRFFNTYKIAHIPLPTYSILLAFGLTPFYNQYNHDVIDFYHLIYLAFLIILTTAIKEKNQSLLLKTIIALALTFSIRFVHLYYAEHFPPHNNSANEIREFLFALCCLGYAFFIHQKPIHQQTDKQQKANS